MPPSVHEVYISLGANIGEPLAQLAQARKAMQASVGTLAKSSQIYLSEPWGLADQPWFYNQVISLFTNKSPREVLDALLAIEQQMGRQRKELNEPRPIDLDVLLYDSEIVDKDQLHIPHPRMIYRNFVLIPLMEIAGDLIHPITGISIEDHYMNSQDDLEVRLIEEI